jgi:hypothetical protein
MLNIYIINPDNATTPNISLKRQGSKPTLRGKWQRLSEKQPWNVWKRA